MRSWTKLAVLLVAVAATGFIPASSVPQVSHASPCVPIEGLSLPEPQTTDLRLPVVVHYMVRTGSRHDVADQITPAMLQDLFGEHGRVISLWQQAGIRPYLRRVEKCRISFATFGLSVNREEELPSPAGSTAAKTLFRRINETYNARDVSGLDLYVWWGIQKVAGYGDRYVDAGRWRAGAAWIDKDCRANHSCDLLIAHEVGHFLGLCHACTIGAPLRVECTRCLPDSMKKPNGAFVLASCDLITGPRLMRDDNLTLLEPHKVEGTELSACERKLAKEFATRRIGAH